MYSPSAPDLAAELLVPRDNYETPSHVWRYTIGAFELDYDLHASALNAVLPRYGTRATEQLPSGARCWLNPAYGSHCCTIGAALTACVWQRGCTVVALLPALLHAGWWHSFVMRADALFYLERATVRVHYNHWPTTTHGNS